MKFASFFGLLIILSTACQSSKSETLVKTYIETRNSHNFEDARAVLAVNYEETIFGDFKEIENLTQLKAHFDWGRIMKSNTQLESIKTEQDKVITVERFSNDMDAVLGRKHRRFIITYWFKNDKILRSNIDTLPGFKALEDYNKALNNALFEFWNKEDSSYHIDSYTGPHNKAGAQALKKILELYKVKA